MTCCLFCCYSVHFEKSHARVNSKKALQYSLIKKKEDKSIVAMYFDIHSIHVSIKMLPQFV